MAERRQVSIFVNGREVANNLKSIYAEKRKINRELNQMTIGSAEYNAKVKELRGLNNTIADHRKKIGQVESTWMKLGKGISTFAGIAGVAFGAEVIIGYGKELFRLGTEMDTLGRKAQTVLAEELARVTERAKENAAAMGLTTGQYVDATTAIADLLIPMQFTRREAADISTELVDLSGALAEWTGGQRTAEEVTQILGKAILGEREQLKELGISIQEADVQARLAEKGLKDLTGAALQQAKAAATLELITEKSADAQAAFAENSDSLIRKQAELRARFQSIQESLATTLIPVFERLLSVIEKVVDTYDKVTDPVKAAASAFDEQAKKVADLESELPPLLDRYEELTSKSTLTKDEQDELAKVIQRIGEITPTAITQVDEYGRILGINASKSREFLEAEQARLQFINQKGIKTIQQQIEASKDRVKFLQAEIEAGGRLQQSGSGLSGNFQAFSASEIESRRKEIEQLSFTIKGANEELKRLKGEIDAPAADTPTDLNRDVDLKTQADAERAAKEREKQAKKEAEKARREREKEAERRKKEEAKAEEDRLKLLQSIAENYLQQEIEAQTQRDQAELDRIEQFEIDKFNTQQDIQRALNEQFLSDRELAILQTEEFYKSLLFEAQKFGIDTVELERARREALAQIEAEYNQKDLEAVKKVQEQKLQAFQSSFSALGSAFGQLYDTLAEEEGDFLVLQKAATLAQIAVDTASAISALTAASELNPANAVTFGAAGIAQFAAGIIRILSNIALAKKTLFDAPEVPQRYTGGWLGVRGADDGRTYNARYIGEPTTGMLNYNHPVLINSASGQPVLGNERGVEYFVSNRDLNKPAVLNHVRAIDNIVKAKQMQSGGFVNASPTPAGGAAPTAGDSNNIMMTMEVLEAVRELNSLLKGGIYAIVDDDFVIDLRKKERKLNKASGDAL